jgi:predicted HTH domain antitoxin
VLVTVDIPDDLVEQLKGSDSNISRELLEAFAVEGYRAEKLSRGQVSELLGMSFWETEEFLKRRGAYLHYDLSDLKQDRESSGESLSK